MSKYLFIGGSHDGEWINVDDNRRTITLPEPMQVVRRFCDNLPLMVRSETYAAKDWYWGEHEHYLVYAPPGWTNAEIFEKLLKGYRTWKGGANG
jgi:hypothetical protein